MKNWPDWAALAISVILVPVLFAMNARIEGIDVKREQLGIAMRTELSLEVAKAKQEARDLTFRIEEKINKLAASQQEILQSLKQFQIDSLKQQLADLKEQKKHVNETP